MVRWTLYDTLAFLLLLSLLLPSLLIMFIPSTFKRPVSSWKALNLRKTLLMASSVRLKPLNCSRLPFVYAQETLTFLLTQKKFFFSSRRRHTRSLCDWSSECALPISVCTISSFIGMGCGVTACLLEYDVSMSLMLGAGESGAVAVWATRHALAARP